MICQTCGLVRTDCDCSFASSDTIDMQGAGLEAVPFSALPNLDPDPDNLLSYGAAGILAKLPAEILSPPRCQAYASGNLLLTADERAIVPLNSERYDSTGTMHDNATDNSRIYIPVDGVYKVTFVGSFAANASGDRGAYLRKNGVEYFAMQQKPATPSGSVETGVSVKCTDFFEAGEYIESLVQMDGPATLNLLGGIRYSPILTVTYRRRSPFDE